MNHHNFQLESHRRLAFYKLWILFKMSKEQGCKTTRTYYSHFQGGNKEASLKKLRKLTVKHKDKIGLAIIYDNHSGIEIERYNFY